MADLKKSRQNKITGWTFMSTMSKSDLSHFDARHFCILNI